MQVSGTSSLFAPTTAQAATGAGGGLSIGKPSPEDEFLKYASMSPAQRMRQSILDALGVSEDDIRAMDVEKRKAIEAKIKEMIKARIEDDLQGRQGLLLDVKA